MAGSGRYRAVISPEAAADLAAIHDYIANDSPKAAGKFVERVLQSIELLETLPHRTVVERRSDKIKYPVRILPIGRYLIYFRVLENDLLVRILTIRHGARRRIKKFP